MKVAVAYQDNQVAIYEALQKEFANDLSEWGAYIEKNTLTVNFNAPEVLFANGSSELTPVFKKILQDFFPRYLIVLLPFRASIEEVRIEGHTSTIWQKNSTESNAYFNNMALSQGRTREVLRFMYDLDPDETEWVKHTIAAVGFSSAHPIIIDGQEDAKRSRRVSFRISTNAQIEMKRILEINQ